MTTSPQLDFYPVLRMKQLEDIVLFQPWWNDSALGRTLSCDLKTGTMQLVDYDKITKSYSEVYGIIGCLKLRHSNAIAVITDARQVGQVRGFPVFLITGTKVLSGYSSKTRATEDRNMLRLFSMGLSPDVYGGGMYMSSGGDITLNSQKYESAKSAGSAWEKADATLTWNRYLSLPLIEAGAENFVPTIFQGFVSQIHHVFERNEAREEMVVTLIARRSSKRPGTRQWRRGADAEANVANFVESEQLVEFTDPALRSSFVQLRGSIPLMWSQTPNLKYKIPIAIGPSGRSEAALKSHVMSLTKSYGKVTAINLANQTGREGKLSSAYASAAESVRKEIDSFQFVEFDFHKQCGATNYKNLNILWQEIASSHTEAGFWTKSDSTETTRQNGVFRTNCIDTLDRTNVVQGMLARKSLEGVLRERGVLSKEGETIESNFPEFEMKFRILWADHGDEISRHYSGTGAMKSAFTRTGKRDLAGLMDDGIKSMSRYFLNNFRDGVKQDALDLVTGNYKPSQGSPFQGVHVSPAVPLGAAMAMFFVAVMNLHTMGGLASLSAQGLRHVWLYFLLAFIIVRTVLQLGKYLVDSPNLRPDLAVPWAANI